MSAHLLALLLAACPCPKLDEARPTLATCVALADEAEAKLPGFREEADATIHALADCIRKVSSRLRVKKAAPSQSGRRSTVQGRSTPPPST